MLHLNIGELPLNVNCIHFDDDKLYISIILRVKTGLKYPENIDEISGDICGIHWRNEYIFTRDCRYRNGTIHQITTMRVGCMIPYAILNNIGFNAVKANCKLITSVAKAKVINSSINK